MVTSMVTEELGTQVSVMTSNKYLYCFEKCPKFLGHFFYLYTLSLEALQKILILCIQLFNLSIPIGRI